MCSCSNKYQSLRWLGCTVSMMSGGRDTWETQWEESFKVFLSFGWMQRCSLRPWAIYWGILGFFFATSQFGPTIVNFSLKWMHGLMTSTRPISFPTTLVQEPKFEFGNGGNAYPMVIICTTGKSNLRISTVLFDTPRLAVIAQRVQSVA